MGSSIRGSSSGNLAGLCNYQMYHIHNSLSATIVAHFIFIVTTTTWLLLLLLIHQQQRQLTYEASLHKRNCLIIIIIIIVIDHNTTITDIGARGNINFSSLIFSLSLSPLIESLEASWMETDIHDVVVAHLNSLSRIGQYLKNE